MSIGSRHECRFGLAIRVVPEAGDYDRRNCWQPRMDLWIQPCALCADLYGQPSTASPHRDLTLNGVGAVKDARAEEHYTCIRCRGAFARILAGPSARQIWMLLNAGQH